MATSDKKANETKARKPRARSQSKARPDAERSAFFGAQTGALVGAAVAGAAVGLAANYGRKMLMQSPAFVSGNWDEALKTEHEMTLALFDQLESTGDDATATRAGLVAKIKYALGKHALQEESVIYPVMREANEAHDADELNGEHGYVKTYLYELENMAKDSPEFLGKISEFRTLLEGHMRNEEDVVFPRLRAAMSEEQNRKVTLAMTREG
jgi:hemerythrin superfamily protein